MKIPKILLRKLNHFSHIMWSKRNFHFSCCAMYKKVYQVGIFAITFHPHHEKKLIEFTNTTKYSLKT